MSYTIHPVPTIHVFRKEDDGLVFTGRCEDFRVDPNAESFDVQDENGVVVFNAATQEDADNYILSMEEG